MHTSRRAIVGRPRNRDQRDARSDRGPAGDDRVQPPSGLLHCALLRRGTYGRTSFCSEDAENISTARLVTPRGRFYLKESLISIALWTGLIYLYWFVAFYGTSGMMNLEGSLKDYIDGPRAQLEVLLDGTLMGLFFAVVHYFSERPALRRRSFGAIILIKTLLYLVALALVSVLVFGFFSIIGLLPTLTDQQWSMVLAPRFSISVLVYLAFCTVLINLLTEVRRKLGPGVLSQLMTGHYYHPREEDRVFLFLDLKGSTTLAERMGHKQYSQFIRSCFSDLSDVVLHFDAQIYQYVGDEIVLSWSADQSQAEDLMTKLFLEYKELLESKSDHYRERFGDVPVFRGGAERGLVIATEVGDVKREIAYHGDVLNTAARLQALCKEYDVDFLVSGQVKEALTHPVHTVHRGALELRGKSERVDAYSVAPLY